MSVREIKNGRFHGLRVQRNVEGKPVIKHWSFRIPVRKGGAVTSWRDATPEEQAKMTAAANAHDTKLKKKQEAGREAKAYDPFKATVRNNTGIRGLNFRLRKEYNSLVECFFVAVVDDNGKLWNRYHRISTLGWQGAWDVACEDIARLKHLTPVVLSRMKAKIPDQKAMKTKVKPK